MNSSTEAFLVEAFQEAIVKVCNQNKESDAIITGLGGVIQTLIKVIEAQQKTVKDVIAAVQEGESFNHSALDILETKLDNLFKLADELTTPIIHILNPSKKEDQKGHE